jgi:acyl-CoA thioester hydrolase
MFQHSHKLRVRYAETDRMGYVYYGNYAAYFEVARVEALRSLGITYKELEDDGILLPVLEYKSKYFKPAFYDDELRIETKIVQKPGIRIMFEYSVFNQEGIELVKGETTLVFVSATNGKPTKPPIHIEACFKQFFD